MKKEFALALRRFDQSTNEDILSANSIVDQLEQFSKFTIESIIKKGYVNILDVGSGAGVKAALIAQHMKKKFNVSVTLDSFEPNDEQCAFLLETYKKSTHFSGKIFNTVFDCKVLDKKYDYILFLHSLYQFDRDSDGCFTSLHDINSRLENQGVCIFMLKSPEGDFEGMKRHVFPIFGKQNPISIYNIQHTLQRLNIPYKIGNNVPMTFPIDHSKTSSEVARDISFVLFDTLHYMTPADEQFEVMGKWMTENAHNYDGRKYLNIPDTVIFAYKT